MENAESIGRASTGGRLHARIAWGLLAGVCLVIVSVDLLARSEWLVEAMESRFLVAARKTHSYYVYKTPFITGEDRLILEAIPNADYSRGGLYFFGSSNMAWGLGPIDLPEEFRGLVGNYGMDATNHRHHLQLIRYLAEHRGFFQAGEGKMHVVLGASYHAARPYGRGPTGFFASLWTRHKLYTYDGDTGIKPAEITSVERWLRIERARCSGFLFNVLRLVRDSIKTRGGQRPPRGHSPEAYNRYRRRYMGARWQRNMEVSLADLEHTLRYVRQRKGKVTVVFLPQGSWERGVPFGAAYRSRVREICGRASTPILDLTDLLADEEYFDSNHFTPAGQKKFEEALKPLILRHVRSL